MSDASLLMVVAPATLLVLVGAILLIVRASARGRAVPMARERLRSSAARSEPPGQSWHGAVRSAALDARPQLRVALLAEAATASRLAGDAPLCAADAFLADLERESRLPGRGEDPVHLLDHAMVAANGAVRRLHGTDDPGATSTTLTAVLVDGDQLYWIAAGDIRVLLLRGPEIHQATTDHTFATLLAGSVARGQLAPEEAPTKKDREALTSTLGTTDPPKVDRSLRPFPLRDGDSVILLTASLYRRITPAEMANILAEPTVDPAAALLDASGIASTPAPAPEAGAALVLSISATTGDTAGPDAGTARRQTLEIAPADPEIAR